jgi:hypothetical protein
MRIYDRYEEYLKAFVELECKDPVVYAAEVLAQSCVCDSSAAYVLWSTSDGIEAARVRTEGSVRRIDAVIQVAVRAEEQEYLWMALMDKSVRKWLNMCHFRIGDNVRYDDYYDRFPAFHNDSAPTVGVIHNELSEWFGAHLNLEGVSSLYICGDLADCNILQYVVQSRFQLPVYVLPDVLTDSPSDSVSLTNSYEYRIVFMEEGSDAMVQGCFPANEIVAERSPDVDLGVVHAYVLELTSRTDMMGNSLLSVTYADGGQKTFEHLTPICNQ